MGIFKQAKASMVRDDAERAWKEGRRVFVGRFEESWLTDQTSGAVRDAAEMIEAVEDVGWVMHNFTTSQTKSNLGGDKGVIVCLFRRS